MNQMLGRRSRPWFLQPKIVEMAAPVTAALSEAMGRQPLLCAESARVLLNGHRYDGSKAIRGLDLEYSSLDETLDRTLSWFRREGFLG